MSDPTFAGLIQLVPDAPIDLTNDAATTDATVIRFTWSDGPSDGGSQILDYYVYYNQGADVNSEVLLASALTSREYTTVVSLVPGLLYDFKVSARNSVGEGLKSEVIQIYAAETPDPPLNVVNIPGITTAYQVGLSWNDGVYDGGSPILDYLISYRLSTDTGDYTIFATDWIPRQGTVTGLTAGLTYTFVVQSRNVIGHSDYSTSINVFAVQVPDAPTGLSDVPEVTL